MDRRVLFKKEEQREFLDLVIARLNAVSLRGLIQFGIDVRYSSLKNYYTERRLLPVALFEDLVYLSKMDVKDFDVEYVKGNWGQVKGGKSRKRRFKN